MTIFDIGGVFQIKTKVAKVTICTKRGISVYTDPTSIGVSAYINSNVIYFGVGLGLFEIEFRYLRAFHRALKSGKVR